MIDYHLLVIVSIFIILDIISGIAQAVKNKNISSKIMRAGLWHKFSYVLIISLAYLCEYSTIYLDLGLDIPIANTVISFIVITELTSVIENVKRLNEDIAKSKIFDLFDKS